MFDTPPKAFDFPDLSEAKAIGLDIETRDPNLKKLGTGVRRGDGYITGISVAVPDGPGWYFPMAHERGENIPQEQVLAWAKDNLTRPHQRKVGANLMYDLDWLYGNGVKVAGPFIDTQVAEPLLDEFAKSYSLEALAQKYLNRGKVEDGVERWIINCLPHVPKKNNDIKANLWRAPSHVVAPYAIADARLPLEIYRRQHQELHREGLLDLFKLETDLIPVLLGMKQRGVRVDIGGAADAEKQFSARIVQMQEELNEQAGEVVSVNNEGGSLVRLLDKLGLKYPMTAKGNPSIQQAWLAEQGHAMTDLILDIRKAEKFNGTFIQGGLLQFAVNGRLHADYHQLRKADGTRGHDQGTVSGRLASSKPNAQNFPSRDPELGKRIRSMFLPEQGELFAKLDYKAVEPRLLLHIASIKCGADGKLAKAIKQLNNEPDLDIYQPLMDLLPAVGRNQIKSIQLGRMYSMGKDKMAKSLGMSTAEAAVILDQFDAAAPYIKASSYRLSDDAKARGYIATLLGRKCRFPLWETSEQKWASDFSSKQEHYAWLKDHPALPEAEARRAYNNKVQRAFTYKALNRYCQGSSADAIKKAMVELHQAGVLNEVSLLGTVHDELDLSVPQTPRGKEALREAVHIMENVAPLAVPLRVDVETGPSWGQVT